MKKLLVATTNQGKIKEIQKMLGDLSYEVIGLNDLDDERFTDMEVKETGDTFSENARIKAETWGKLTGLLTVADDSGLEVEALLGAPGVFSKRYETSDEQRNEKLLGEMAKVPDEKRQAQFVCVVAMYDPESNTTELFEGKTTGTITKELRGDHGFGYDPVFISDELNKTFAEADMEEKNKVSHRGRALYQLIQYLK